ncbi:MAG: peptide-methionine (S)-S-oxide reductase [Flavobacteriaceae bacterium]|nr:peptide-methionine (S)-S-oxide reductase [Flavobacteriaceae bacterium]
MNEKMKQIVFAGGCFWCTEAVFQRLEGVEDVVPGFAGGNIKNPAYREVITGRTGHAECVQVTYNPERVSLHTLLEVFFATHDPTTLNRQQNDVGTQYRSAIYYSTAEEKENIKDFISHLAEQEVFENPIVTQVEPLEAFYTAEVTHHDYYNQNTSQPYCQYIISPKIEKIKKFYSEKLKTNA